MEKCLLICAAFMTSLCLPVLSLASEPTDSKLEIRPFEENSTDALGMLGSLIKADRFYAAGQYAEAARLYDLVSQFDPSLSQATIGHAKSQLALKNPNRAIEILSGSSMSSPEAEILLSEAMAMVLPKENVETYLEGRLDLYNDARLWNLLGQLRDKNGDIEKAREAYRAAENLGQRSGVLENNLGLSALRQGNYATAVTHLSRAVALSPTSQKIDNNRRLALLLSGNYISALEELTSEDSVAFILDAALIARHQNEVTLAAFLYQKAIDISPVYHERAQRGLKVMRSQNL